VTDAPITPDQCRAARAILGISQEQLCQMAGISRAPLADFEKGKTKPYPRTLAALRQTLKGAGVVFVDPNGDGPGVRLKGK
jgi:transcriptional regulator with XRE-family HTH domain